MKWAASGVIALSVVLGGLLLLDRVGEVTPLSVLLVTMVGFLVGGLVLDLIHRRAFDEMWARLLVVAAAATFGVFVSYAMAWVGYVAASAVLLAMLLRSRRQGRVTL